ncbi:MAG: PEP-CTERM sorting domain-containing protein [Planctomycetota bacterium]
MTIVPEPSSVYLLLLGLTSLAAVGRRPTLIRPPVVKRHTSLVRRV